MTIQKKFFYLFLIIVISAILVQMGRTDVFSEILGIRYQDSGRKTEIQSAEIPEYYKKYTVFFSTKDEGSRLLLNNVVKTFDMVKLNYSMYDVSAKEAVKKIAEMPKDELLVIATENIKDFQKPETIREFIAEGGKAVFLIRPYYTEFDDVLGIKENRGFSRENKKGIKFISSFFPGLDELELNSRKIIHSMLDIDIEDDCNVIAVSSEDKPLMWSRNYGEGKIFLVNSTMLMDKINRGVLLNCINYTDEYAVNTIFNGKIINIDDFPAPIKFEKDETIYGHYHMSNSNFYRYVWWSDMKNLAEKYDLKYTGLLIGTYNNNTESPLPLMNEKEVQDIEYFGRKIFELSGEIGIHGYNHNSLALEGQMNFEDYGYIPWRSAGDMEEGLAIVRDKLEELYGDIRITTFVPASNLVSPDGKRAVKKVFPDVEVFAGVYSGTEEQALLIQEFGRDSDVDGVYSFPRLSSGYDKTPEKMWDIYNGIAHFGLVNHFIHPDDLLDPERAQGQKWEELEENINSIFGDINKRFPFLNPYTNKEAVSRYKNNENLKVYSQKKGKEIIISYVNMVPPVNHYLFTGKSRIKNMQDGEYFMIDDETGMYLIISKKSIVKIHLTGGE